MTKYLSAGAWVFGGALHEPPDAAAVVRVFTLRDDRIAAITGFPDTSVFRSFGLPRTLPE